MSKFSKSNMTVNGNSIHVSMPFAKVDEAKRLVSGYATLDNLDTQGDVVLAEASAKAFARARGNIREMHQPLAVGRMVDWREDEFFDTEEQTFYRGIFVTARVSEGAEDTWKKVLDGTLTGFSIGGEIIEASNEFVKEAGKTVRFIKDYDLVELSLVDNPANQLANIHSLQKSVFSISKSATGTVKVEGMVAETILENVFICPVDDTVLVKSTESATCPECDTKMESAGWFESGADRAEKVNAIVSKFRNPAEQEAAPSSEGGVDMGNVTKAEETTKEVSVPNPSETHPDGEKIETEAKATVEEEAAEVNEVDDADETPEGEEPAEAPEEVQDEATEISKKIDALHDAIQNSLEENKTETAERVAELEKKIDETHAEFFAKATEIEEKINGFGEKIEAQKNRLAELESNLEKFNSSDAFRKSADVSPAVTSVQKDTFWDGAFS